MRSSNISGADLCLVAAAGRGIAETMRTYATEIDKVCDKMDERGDPEYAAEILQAVTNCMFNLRLDLVPTRLVRGYER